MRTAGPGMEGEVPRLAAFLPRVCVRGAGVHNKAGRAGAAQRLGLNRVVLWQIECFRGSCQPWACQCSEVPARGSCLYKEEENNEPGRAQCCLFEISAQLSPSQ